MKQEPNDASPAEWYPLIADAKSREGDSSKRGGCGRQQHYVIWHCYIALKIDREMTAENMYRN